MSNPWTTERRARLARSFTDGDRGNSPPGQEPLSRYSDAMISRKAPVPARTMGRAMFRDSCSPDRKALHRSSRPEGLRTAAPERPKLIHGRPVFTGVISFALPYGIPVPGFPVAWPHYPADRLPPAGWTSVRRLLAFYGTSPGTGARGSSIGERLLLKGAALDLVEQVRRWATTASRSEDPLDLVGSQDWGRSGQAGGSTAETVSHGD